MGFAYAVNLNKFHDSGGTSVDRRGAGAEPLRAGRARFAVEPLIGVGLPLPIRPLEAGHGDESRLAAGVEAAADLALGIDEILVQPGRIAVARGGHRLERGRRVRRTRAEAGRRGRGRSREVDPHDEREREPDDLEQRPERRVHGETSFNPLAATRPAAVAALRDRRYGETSIPEPK